jgi:hypothetical protein
MCSSSYKNPNYYFLYYEYESYKSVSKTIFLIKCSTGLCMHFLFCEQKSRFIKTIW